MLKIFTKLPVVLVLIFISLMFVVDEVNILPSYTFKYKLIFSLIIFFSGVLIILIAGYSFKKAQTTVNPMTPEKTTQLVKTGIYKYSRNPMYIGFTAWLLACVVFIGNPAHLLLPPLYVLLVNKLYIVPEENALEKLFKQEFTQYKSRVRRWL